MYDIVSIDKHILLQLSEFVGTPDYAGMCLFIISVSILFRIDEASIYHDLRHFPIKINNFLFNLRLIFL